LVTESFCRPLLEHPQYTRPQVWEGIPVPEVLLSGHHKRIKQWQWEQSCTYTRERRPDLWASYVASERGEEK
jgi:tRNA (guanine37-N1)-methyltransferase